MNKKPNRNSSAGAAADSSTTAQVTTSSHNRSKPHVGCCFLSNDKKQRVLKFKCWNHKSNVMYENVCIDNFGNANDGTSFLNYSEKDAVLQFINILDCQGNEIYEADLISQTNFNGEQYEALYKVVYDYNGFCLEMIKGNEKAMSNTGLSSFGNIVNNRLKKGVVVGNYYSHPELLGCVPKYVSS
jgi:YopX protein